MAYAIVDLQIFIEHSENDLIKRYKNLRLIKLLKCYTIFINFYNNIVYGDVYISW